MKENSRIFFTAFVVTLCVLLLFLGVLLVDYESRKIGFDDGNSVIQRLLGFFPDWDEFKNEILNFFDTIATACFLKVRLL